MLSPRSLPVLLVYFISHELKHEGYQLKVVVYTLAFVHTFILAVGKGVSLVEVHVAERIRISAGFFCHSFQTCFIHQLPLLWIILYIRSIHLVNKVNLISDLSGASQKLFEHVRRLDSKSADYITLLPINKYFTTNQLCEYLIMTFLGW